MLLILFITVVQVCPVFVCPCHPFDLLTPFSFIMKFQETYTSVSLLNTSDACKSFVSEVSVHWAADKCSFSSKTHRFLTIGEKNTFRKLVCGLLQFVPHQQYSSKELAHSYKCVFKLKMYSVLILMLCSDYGRKILISNSQEHISTGRLGHLLTSGGEECVGSAKNRTQQVCVESLPCRRVWKEELLGF